MIRHGASEVFAGSGDGGDPNDIDIDKLLKEGQDKTEEMDKQMDGQCLKIITWYFFEIFIKKLFLNVGSQLKKHSKFLLDAILTLFSRVGRIGDAKVFP